MIWCKKGPDLPHPKFGETGADSEVIDLDAVVQQIAHGYMRQGVKLGSYLSQFSVHDFFVAANLIHSS